MERKEVYLVWYRPAIDYTHTIASIHETEEGAEAKLERLINESLRTGDGWVFPAPLRP